jgi:sialic acid synthase SpsE
MASMNFEESAVGVSIHLGKREVTRSSSPYVIAEIGVNHEGSLERAMRLIDLAKQGGADAAKFQTYKADKLATKYSPAYWDTSKEASTSQHSLFGKYDGFEISDYIKLARHCEKMGITFLSTPFDHDAVDYLNELVPFFKIASADITNIPLLRHVASKAKPVLLSTGASTLGEIDTALEELKGAGASDIALLHCILNYPTDYADANISMIRSMANIYPEYLIGYSDHTIPDSQMSPMLLAYLSGATILEKHFTDNKNQVGNDHYHAMDAEDLKKFLSQVTTMQKLLGGLEGKRPISSEIKSRKFARRSIVSSRDLAVGEVLKEADLICLRPGEGIAPLHWDQIVGKTLDRPIAAGQPLKWSDLKD